MAFIPDSKRDLSLRTACSELGRLSDQWYKIGIQLGVPLDVLKQFGEERDPISAVIDYWLEGHVKDTGVSVSWNTIVAALKTDALNEPELAERIDTKYCHETKVERGTGEPLEAPPPPPDKNKMHPDVEMDLNFILERYLDELITRYASYVDCLRATIDARGVTTEELKQYLMSLPAFNSNYKGKPVPLLVDKWEELKKKKTITDIFSFLTVNHATYFNYDTYQSILEHWDVPEERDRLRYRDHHLAYLKKHKACEYIRVAPQLRPRMGTVELHLKYDMENTVKLAKVFELKDTICDILDLTPMALHIIDFEEESNVVVVFLISATIASILFTPTTVFCEEKVKAFREALVAWIECNGCTFRFGQGESKAETEVVPTLIGSKRGRSGSDSEGAGHDSGDADR